MLYRAGYDDVSVFERGARVGGVWHANTYPGAACDVSSHLHEFSFSPNPNWSRRYPRKLRSRPTSRMWRCHGVFDRIHTNTEVLTARWNSPSALDALESSQAQRIEVRQEVADSFDAELRGALADTVWHTGCSSWYVDQKGHNPTLWPWTATAYRRRTATIDPAAYQITSGEQRLG
jgi:phytoene dehydrogenase-like protein